MDLEKEMETATTMDSALATVLLTVKETEWESTKESESAAVPSFLRVHSNGQ